MKSRLSLITVLVLISSAASSVRAADPATLRGLGHFSESALSTARAKVKSSPQDADAWTQLGKHLMRKYVDGGRGLPVYTEGLAALDKALSIDSSAALALAYRGVLKAARAKDEDDKGLAKAGLADLDSALSKQPSTLITYLNAAVSVEVPRRWGRAANSGERLEKVTQTLARDTDQAVEHDINIGQAYMKLAKYYREEKNFDRAIEAWKKVVEFDPNSSDGREATKQIQKYSGGGKQGGWAPPGSWQGGR